MKNKARRNFLIYLFGLIGSLPFIQSLKLNKKFYFFMGSVHGKYEPKKTDETYMKRSLFQVLNDKMFQQGKLVKFRYIPSGNKTSWLYVFDSQKSYREWFNEVEKNEMLSLEEMPSHLEYSEKEGYLNSSDLFSV